MLTDAGVQVSMDGRGPYLDNISIERLWRSLKYECVYLHVWEAGSEAKAGVRKWVEFYNHKRPIFRPWWATTCRGLYWQRTETTNPDQQVQSIA